MKVQRAQLRLIIEDEPAFRRRGDEDDRSEHYDSEFETDCESQKSGCSDAESGLGVIEEEDTGHEKYKNHFGDEATTPQQQLRKYYRMSLLPEGIISWDQMSSCALALREDQAWQKGRGDVRSSVANCGPTMARVASHGGPMNVLAKLGKRMSILPGTEETSRVPSKEETEDLSEKTLLKYGQYCEELNVRLSRCVEGVIKDRTLTSADAVSLAHFGLGDRGVLPVVRLLQLNDTVRTLILSDNGLTDGGLLTLLNNLENQRTLRVLDLARNIKISNRSTTPLLRHLLQMTNLHVLNLEATRMVEAKREVLYLQAYANRCGKCRSSTFMTSSSLAAITREPELSRLRARVEDMARRFQLCRGRVCVCPNGALFQTTGDVWVHQQEFEAACMLHQRWQYEYKHLEAAAKQKRELKDQQRVYEVQDIWIRIVRLYYFQNVKPKGDAAEQILIADALLRTRVDVANELLRLDKLVHMAAAHGVQACYDFIVVIEDRIEELKHRLHEKSKLRQLFRAVTWTIFFVRTTARNIATKIREVCKIDLQDTSKEQLLETAKELQVLWQRGVKAHANSASLLLAKKKFKACMLPLYGNDRQGSIEERRNGSIRNGSKDERSSSKEQRLATLKEAQSGRTNMNLGATPEDQATNLEASLRKQLDRFLAWNNSLVSSVKPAEFVVIAKTLVEMLDKASTGLDVHMDIDLIFDTVEWVSMSEAVVSTVQKEQTKISNIRTGFDQVYAETMYPYDKEPGRRAIIMQAGRLNDIKTALETALALEMKATSGEAPDHGVLRLRHLVLKGLEADLQLQIMVLRNDLVVAGEALGKPPEFFAFEDHETVDGRALNIVMSLYKTISKIHTSSDKSSQMISTLCDCRSRLGYVTKRERKGDARSKESEAVVMFSSKIDEQFVSLNDATDRLNKFRFSPVLSKEVFGLLDPFSFSNLRRLFEILTGDEDVERIRGASSPGVTSKKGRKKTIVSGY